MWYDGIDETQSHFALEADMNQAKRIVLTTDELTALRTLAARFRCTKGEVLRKLIMREVCNLRLASGSEEKVEAKEE